MDPINRAERNASILNFVLVYILITAIPVGVTYMLTRKAGGSGSNQKAIAEQQGLANEMSALQAYVKKMEEMDKTRPEETAANETWNVWISDAERQNNEFRSRIEQFNKNNAFTGARLQMRNSACSYLYRLNTERRNYLAKRTELARDRNETAELEKMRNQNQQLTAEKTNLQNQVNMANTIMAAQAAQAQQRAAAPDAGGGGGGGGGGGKREMEELKLQLVYSDANCKKVQADLLGNYNEVNRRRKLYTDAKQQLLTLSQNRQASSMLQQMVSEKLLDINQAMNRLQ